MKFSTFLKKEGFRKMKKKEIGDWNCYERNGLFIEINDYRSWENVFVVDGKETHTFDEIEDLANFLNGVNL